MKFERPEMPFSAPSARINLGHSSSRIRLLAVLLLATLVLGCVNDKNTRPATVVNKSNPTSHQPVEPPSSARQGWQGVAEPGGGIAKISTVPAATKSEQAQIWQRLTGGYRLQYLDHPRIEQEMRRLSLHKPSFHALMERGTPYLSLILDEVEKRGLPTELALLPAIESSYKPTALSTAGAVGLWQFMPATARHYDLEMDWWYDGRRDTVAATRAALDYLEYLNKRFDGDWPKALAAYNAGGTKVARAVRRNRRQGEPTDYWQLDLPRETDRYVPKLIALARLIDQPESHGLVLPLLDERQHYRMVDAGSQVDLHVAARLAEVPVNEFVALNAGYHRAATRPQGPHHFLVPADAARRLSSALADLPASQRLRWTQHSIRNGDTLGGIARRYGVSAASIKRANQMNSNRIIAGDALLIPLSESLDSSLLNRKQDKTPIQYRVRQGDSLYVIAKRFGVSIKSLRSWNQIAGGLITPGQKLLVYLDSDHKDAMAQPVSPG